MEWLSNPSAWVALLTLTVLEIVLGIDNVIFISILSNKLPEALREKGRQIGLMMALVTRILLLLSINVIKKATAPLITLPIAITATDPKEVEHFKEMYSISGRDLILGLGGLFLIWKSVKEIHAKLEGEDHATKDGGKAVTFAGVILQIMVLDIVFSLDSVITAIGMAEDLGVMITAVIIAVVFMLAFAGKISSFVEKHPTVKMLALSFLVLIGVNLVAEAGGQHIEKGYTYFAMAFAVGVEMLNIRVRKGAPVKLKSGSAYGNPSE